MVSMIFNLHPGGYVIQIDNEQSIMEIIPPFHGDMIVAKYDHNSALVLSHLLLVLFIVNVIMSLHLIAFIVLSVISALLLIVKKHSKILNVLNYIAAAFTLTVLIAGAFYYQRRLNEIEEILPALQEFS
ncbi:hypothetical protein [Geomicrobium sp. JCM 19055]|uniref:hypothetical protein n=1 Tax=Geomicrobium sp. JCM 19055 TaxID=1460649 RepID=UPI001267D77C|nr:hypothetical protein [Geomicrobium sp. JCM 19055]